MGTRRKSRELVIQVLYAIDISEDIENGDFILNQICEKKENYKFAKALLDSTLKHLSEIDKLITDTASNWKLERMSAVDKSILREAICEICYWDDIPHKVSINEAIELAKKYGTEKSGAFVNGLLDKIAHYITKIKLENNKKNLS